MAAALADSAFAGQVAAIASEIRAHRFPLLGLTIETGPEVRWRRDYRSEIESSLDYFRFIPYLDASRSGDHKLIWELNRHQHLVVLAQAYLFTGDPANLDEIRDQLDSWFEQNPYARGINWASALEVAFRALSWMWIDHFIGQDLPADFRSRWLAELYRHGCFLERNLSIYFSPNTHLLGEALALHALGMFFEPDHRAIRWRRTGQQVMQQQIERQTRADGGHIEQSTYYHVYAMDMFLLHGIFARQDPAYYTRLARMADYLDAIIGPSRKLPPLGDDDGGRLFHPYGPRDEFARATLATAGVVNCASDLHSQACWWRESNPAVLPAMTRASRLFADTGIAVMVSGQNHVIVNAGQFGPWSAGHSHAGALSIVARAADTEILIDPGTFTYTADPLTREWFRSTGAHNTIRIDGLDQATPAGPFGWTDLPQVRILSWSVSTGRDVLQAECRYRGFTHRRRVEFQKPGLLIVTDDVDGSAGLHDVEQLWHIGSEAARDRLTLAEGAECVDSWRSTTFGERHLSLMVRVRRRCRLPLRLEARIQLSP